MYSLVSAFCLSSLLLACSPKSSEIKSPLPKQTSDAFKSSSSAEIVEVVSSPEGYAWWLRTRYHPVETNFRGIPANALNPKWCYLQQLTEQSFPKGLFAKDFGHHSNHESNPFFIADPFGSYKKPHFLALAAYKFCDGSEAGIATLLVDESTEELKVLDWSTDNFIKGGITVLAIPSELEKKASIIPVWYCTDCDHGALIEFDLTTKKLIFKSNMDE